MKRLAAFWALCLLLACGGGGGGGTSASAPPPAPAPTYAPNISNLQLWPASAVVGDGGGSIPSTLSLDFSDSDGDVTSIRVTYAGQNLDSTISGLSGMKNGTIQGTLLLNTSAVGSFTFQVSLIDAKGHVSNTLSVTFIVNDHPALPPTISFLSPMTLVMGGPAFTLTVTGTNFFPDSQVLWNGYPRTTTYVAPDTLTAAIDAQDIATAGTAAVKVLNPILEGGTSSSRPVTIGSLGTLVVPEIANDVAWDPSHNLLFASIPSTSLKYGNRIVAIDPLSGAITASVFAGSEPNRMAVSGDGQFLYVGLDGSSYVKRFLLPTLVEDISIPLGASLYDGPNIALDLQVAPNAPHTIAVSLASKGVSPSAQGGITIFDDAVARPVTAPGGSALYTTLQWGADDHTLYAANNQTTGFDYYILSVDASGVTQVKDLWSVFSSFGNMIHFEPTTNRIYSGSGQVLNPSDGQLVGSFAAMGTMIPYASLNSAFYLVYDPTQYGSYKLQKFHLTQFTLQNTLSLAMPQGDNYYGLQPRRLVAWGSAGLATCGNGFPLCIHTGPFIDGTAATPAAAIAPADGDPERLDATPAALPLGERFKIQSVWAER